MARFDERETLGAGAFDYPFGIGAFLLGGTSAAPVLYAATLSGGGIGAFVPDGAGGLTHIGSVGYPGTLVPGTVPTLARFSVNGADSLLVAGLGGAALVTQPNGAPQSWTTVPAAEGFAAFAPVGGGVILAARHGGGIATLGATAGAPDLLSAVDGPRIDGILRLPDGSVHAISGEADTITRYTLSGSGLVPGQVAGALDGLGWSGPSALGVAAAGGAAYLVVASAGSSSLTTLTFDGSVYRIADHIVDDRFTRFDGVVALATASVNGRTFVAAGGADDGVSLFELLPGGRLVLLQSLEDMPGRSLNNVTALTLFRAGSHLQLVVTGQEGGITAFSRPVASLAAPLLGGTGGDHLTGGGADDLLMGGAGDDVLSGGGGDDVIHDGDGADSLRGGSGADLFVFASDGASDTVEDFRPGVDRLDLSAFPLLYATGELTITPTAWGARIVYGDEVINLRSWNGSTIERDDLGHADLIGVSRPPLVPIGRDVTGSSGADALFGADGADRLRGLAGDDTLDGLLGNDLLVGGAGRDTVDGGEGRDVGSGGAGGDIVRGGPGGDLLLGGPGDDSLEGGAGADVISGGGGADRIEGGPGNDTLRGGLGADVFVFRSGSGFDRIADFAPGTDRVDLSDHPGFSGFAAVAAALADGPDGAVLALGGGASILLAGVDAAALGADDFLF